MTDATVNPVSVSGGATLPGVGFLFGLLALRWAAGIAENFGLAMASEGAAVIMLSGLAIGFLQDLRLTRVSIVFVAGIVAWMTAAIFSLIANPGTDPKASIFLLSLLILYGLFANALFGRLRETRQLGYVSRVLGVFILFGGLLSGVQIITGSGFVEPGKIQIVRAFGSDVHPVSFAIQMVAALVTLEVIRAKQQRPLTVGFMVLMGVGALALYLTYARTAWVMALFVICYALLTHGAPWRRTVLGALMLGIGPLVLMSSSRFSDLSSLPFFLSNFSFHDVVFDWRYIDNSISWRLVNWSFGLNQALEAPILGYGPGQSALASAFHLEMHNIFLETFFEGGIFGLAAFLVCLWGLIRIHRSLPCRSRADHYTRALANGFGLSLLLAVSFSTSFVDQLMSFLIYLLLLAAALVPSMGQGADRNNLTIW